jgi:hypothetical protein
VEQRQQALDMFFAISQSPVLGVLKILVKRCGDKGSDNGANPKDPMGALETVDDRGTERAGSCWRFSCKSDVCNDSRSERTHDS